LASLTDDVDCLSQVPFAMLEEALASVGMRSKKTPGWTCTGDKASLAIADQDIPVFRAAFIGLPDRDLLLPIAFIGLPDRDLLLPISLCMPQF